MIAAPEMFRVERGDGMVVCNLPRRMAILSAIDSYPKYRIFNAHDKDVTDELLDPHKVEGKVVIRLSGGADLVVGNKPMPDMVMRFVALKEPEVEA